MGVIITKKGKKAMILHLLLNNNEFLEEAIRILYGYQTWDEQRRGKTQLTNNLGFNKTDAPDLTYYANLIAKGVHLQGQNLSNARKRMIKYAAQLAGFEKIQAILFQSQVRGTIIRETPLALLIKVKQQEIWVPKSKVYSRYFPGNPEEQEFLLDQWVIAQKLGGRMERVSI
jgi:hypothetical protein